jgi:putative SOS response-associated peptidase YedK
MCGRFALGIDHEDVFNQLIADGLIPGDEDREWVDRADFYPRYNIAPRTRAPVVRQRRAAPNEERAESPSRLEPVESSSNNESPSPRPPQSVFVQTMRWGLVPQHAKEDAPSLTANTINARVETILQAGSMWHRLAASKRCVVVCDG